MYKNNTTNLKNKLPCSYKVNGGSKRLSSFLEVIKSVNNHSMVTGPPHRPTILPHSPHLVPLPRLIAFYIQACALFSVWAEVCVNCSLLGLEATLLVMLCALSISLSAGPDDIGNYGSLHLPEASQLGSSAHPGFEFSPHLTRQPIPLLFTFPGQFHIFCTAS